MPEADRRRRSRSYSLIAGPASNGSGWLVGRMGSTEFIPWLAPETEANPSYVSQRFRCSSESWSDSDTCQAEKDRCQNCGRLTAFPQAHYRLPSFAEPAIATSPASESLF